jgi:hypothetical protein
MSLVLAFIINDTVVITCAQRHFRILLIKRLVSSYASVQARPAAVSNMKAHDPRYRCALVTAVSTLVNTITITITEGGGATPATTAQFPPITGPPSTDAHAAGAAAAAPQFAAESLRGTTHTAYSPVRPTREWLDHYAKHRGKLRSDASLPRSHFAAITSQPA